MRTALAAAAVLPALLLAGCATDPAASPQADTLPDTTLASFDGGKPLDLSTVKGPAVINVWASWCGPCRRDLPLYQSFAEQYDGKVKVIGVDFQDTRTDRAKELIRDTGVRFPLYSDPDGNVRARVLPQLFLVDEDGKVTYKKYVEITSSDQLESLVEKHLGVTG